MYCWRTFVTSLALKMDGFIVLDTIPVNTNTSTFVIGSSSNDSLVHDGK